MIEPKKSLILVVDDEPDVGMILHRVLGEAGYEVVSAASGMECLRVLKKQTPDLVFMDLRMPGMDGVETLRKIRETHPDLTVVIMTAYQTVTSAVETMKLGAYDYLIKPLDTEKLRNIAKQALTLRAAVQKVPAAGAAPSSLAAPTIPGGMVADGEEMKRLMTLVEKVAPTDMTVLILGESGTGKEVMARAIHEKSARKGKAFVVVDCAALPESLIESELFGHEKGAFTGADAARPGKFETADGGTLFLDEIGNLPLSVQVKLLRFLQDPVVERLGGRKPVRLDVRILAATNAELEKAVKAGTFREDLFHRLKVFLVQLPPLRARGAEDFKSLVMIFVESTCAKLSKATITVAPETFASLKSYPWPGNIRELQNAVSSACLLADDIVRPEHLPMSVQSARPAAAPEPVPPAALNDVIAKVEREHISNTLAQFNGDRAQAARSLGLDLPSLEAKLRSLGL
jgi:DNA-binding NtrC family response regulator